jgi:hypothetical protein
MQSFAKHIRHRSFECTKNWNKFSSALVVAQVPTHPRLGRTDTKENLRGRFARAVAKEPGTESAANDPFFFSSPRRQCIHVAERVGRTFFALTMIAATTSVIATRVLAPALTRLASESGFTGKPRRPSRRASMPHQVALAVPCEPATRRRRPSRPSLAGAGRLSAAQRSRRSAPATG